MRRGCTAEFQFIHARSPPPVPPGGERRGGGGGGSGGGDAVLHICHEGHMSHKHRLDVSASVHPHAFAIFLG